MRVSIQFYFLQTIKINWFKKYKLFTLIRILIKSIFQPGAQYYLCHITVDINLIMYHNVISIYYWQKHGIDLITVLEAILGQNTSEMGHFRLAFSFEAEPVFVHNHS